MISLISAEKLQAVRQALAQLNLTVKEADVEEGLAVRSVWTWQRV